jgi:hypothetical protein
VNKTFREWFSEGETIYAESIAEYQALESQIHDLEAQLNEKRTEVNHVAQMIGKPPVEGSKQLSAQLIDREIAPKGTIGSITRALTGRTITTRQM